MMYTLMAVIIVSIIWNHNCCACGEDLLVLGFNEESDNINSLDEDIAKNQTKKRVDIFSMLIVYLLFVWA